MRDGGQALRRALAVTAAVALLASCAGCTGKESSGATPPPAPSRAGTASSLAGTSKATPTPKPKPVDPLTGGAVSKNPVIAVKIENTQAARPQVGVGQADLVVVEEVEARITRMTGIYHTVFPKRVGPVRSARNTDVRYLPIFGQPGLVYSGANSLVQREIRKTPIVPMERSDRDRSRPMPHNVMVNLNALQRSKNLKAARSIGLSFANQDPRWQQAAKTPRVKVKVGGDTTAFAFTKGHYAVDWNGQPNRDGDSDEPVRCDNVFVVSVQNHHDEHSTSDISVVSETVGKGKATLYRDGRRLTGQWSRDKVSGPMRFRDAAGDDLPLKPGKTWILLQG